VRGWFEQAACGLLLIGVVVIVNRSHVRSSFHRASKL
jgi:hypothetical protein